MPPSAPFLPLHFLPSLLGTSNCQQAGKIVGQGPIECSTESSKSVRVPKRDKSPLGVGSEATMGRGPGGPIQSFHIACLFEGGTPCNKRSERIRVGSDGKGEAM